MKEMGKRKDVVSISSPVKNSSLHSSSWFSEMMLMNTFPRNMNLVNLGTNLGCKCLFSEPENTNIYY